VAGSAKRAQGFQRFPDEDIRLPAGSAGLESKPLPGVD
jgi:hypothetical protein